jgi:CelD/BcsL family acetyltransferase involved in cellulose biosynthesis
MERVHPPSRRTSYGKRCLATKKIAKELAGSKFEKSKIWIYTSFQECEDVWRAAVEQCSCFAFQTFEWQSVWYSTIGKAEGVSPFIIRLTDRRGRTLMILPLGIYNRYGLRSLQFLGGSLSDYNAPLVDAEFATEISSNVFSRLWPILLEALPRVDVIWLRRMPERIEGVRNPLVTLPGSAHTENAHAATLSQSFAAFKATRRTN